jgi:hypothetical protein
MKKSLLKGEISDADSETETAEIEQNEEPLDYIVEEASMLCLIQHMHCVVHTFIHCN